MAQAMPRTGRVSTERQNLRKAGFNSQCQPPQAWRRGSPGGGGHWRSQTHLHHGPHCGWPRPLSPFVLRLKHCMGYASLVLEGGPPPIFAYPMDAGCKAPQPHVISRPTIMWHWRSWNGESDVSREGAAVTSSHGTALYICFS